MAKSKPTRTKLAKKLEKLVAQYVKLRDNNTCQYCGKHVTGSNCHASHVIPKSQGNQYRFDPLNLKVLCYHHHLNWWHKNPLEASKWFKEKFPDRYHYLFGQPREIVKLSVSDYEKMIDSFKGLIKELDQHPY